MTPKTYCEDLKNLIAKNEIDKVIEQLHGLLKNSDKLNEVIMQSARHKELKKQIRMNLIDLDKADINKSQIRAGLLELIDEIDESTTQAEIHEEVQQYAQYISGKNIVAGNIQAGGNVTIGDQIQNVTESKTSRNLRLFLFIFVPLLVIVAAVLFYRYQQAQTPLSLTVGLKDQTPNEYLPFENAEVALAYGAKTETKRITEEAIFQGIPSNFRGEQLNLVFKAYGFETIDTMIQLDQDRVNLPIKRDDTFARMFGVIRDAESLEAIPNAKIEIQDMLFFSEENGRFDLRITFDKQRKQQRLLVTKEGYQPFDRTEPIIKGEETRILLHKTN
jgi:hypothetical protein